MTTSRGAALKKSEIASIIFVVHAASGPSTKHTAFFA